VNIVLAGIMGRYPYGGVAWCSLMYLLGLAQLGHRVWYLEDMAECNFDPVENALSRDPRYALGFIRSALEPHGLGERWCYVDWQQEYHGYSRERWREVCAEADLFINLSGGSWLWRDEYAAIPHSAYIDSDPGFTQLEAERQPRRLEFLARYGARFTFGRNIGTLASPVPTGGLRWHHTWQPVDIERWRPTGRPPREAFTTVMSWRIESFSEIGGNKDEELLRFIDLPGQVGVPLELAISGHDKPFGPGGGRWRTPGDMLAAHGWRCRDAFEVSRDLWAYRDYIASSLGEFSVAKRTYVATNSGWFSDRTECYLASGRPAVVQETGFGAHLPVGMGLLSFRTPEEAREALEAVVADYERHARAARELAAAYFAPGAVLPALLARATAGPEPPHREAGG
jgi:hypothetical protein